MCDKCFPSDFPQEIIKRYNRRNWEFTMGGKPQGKIEHLRFFHQERAKNKQFWKGIEKLKFYSDDRIEYRFCYWANLGDGWKWGQFCPFYPKDILVKVLGALNNKEI